MIEFASTKQVRRGFSAETEERVKKIRQQRNYQGGWAKDSKVPEQVYCPEGIKHMAGPLFCDKAATDAAFDNFFAMHFYEKFSGILCAYCGMPSCTCHGCNMAQRASHKQHPHTCWRQGISGQQPKYDPVHQRPSQEHQLVKDRDEAWAKLGCTMPVKWDGQKKQYKFEAPAGASLSLSLFLSFALFVYWLVSWSHYFDQMLIQRHSYSFI